MTIKIRKSRPKLVAVIGGRKFGKSTIIRSLTGCKNSTHQGTVKDNATGRNIYVVCCSPQESNMKRQKLLSIFRMVDGNRSYTGVVVAIQPTNPSRRIPLEEIFQTAESYGFDSYAFVLKQGRLGDVLDVSSITRRLVRFGVRPKALDGRRFAHINAQSINKHTKIVI